MKLLLASTCCMASLGMTLGIAQPCACDKNDQTHVAEDEFIALFDGETLDGWQKLNGTANYHVDDGCIVGVCDPQSPVNTFLRTEQTFTDFELHIQVKFDVLGNSGIQFRSNQRPADERVADGRVYGYQCELDNNPERGYTGGIYDESRRGWISPLDGEDMAEARAAFNYDGWNDIIIRAEGRHIQTWVNGIACSDFIDDSEEHFTQEGFFALQVHSGEQGTIRWRNIRLRPLDQN